MQNGQLIALKIVCCVGASLLISTARGQANVSKPFACPVRVNYFHLLDGPSGKAAVAGSLYLGLYSKGTDTQAILRKLRPLKIDLRSQYPEGIVAQELYLRRLGNVEGLLQLYRAGASQAAARSLYGDIGYTKRYALQVSRESLIFKANYGPLATIITETQTPRHKFPIEWPYTLKRSGGGDWLFGCDSKKARLFSNLVTFYPYWLPAKKRRFTPTGSYFEIVRHYSKKYPKPDAAVYIRKIHVFDPQIVKAVRHIVHVYQTGSDKDVLAMWRPKDRKRIAKCLAHPNEYTNLRENYRHSSGHNISFRAYPSIIGKDVSLILLQPVGGGDIVVVRLAKIAGKWYQSRESYKSTFVDWLPKYPAYEAYVLAHPKTSVLIKASEPK